MIYKIALLLYVFLYTGIALFVRSYILYRRIGINVFKPMGRSGLQGANERVLMIVAALIPVITFFYLLPRRIYEYLVPIEYLEISLVQNSGIVIMLVGCIIGIISQFQMGDSWRIGINKNESTNLVTKGFYKYSRNPIYLGLMISFIGFFFIAPNAISLCCMVVSYPALDTKIRLEEQYLSKIHGKNFDTYRNNVNRWI